MTLPTTPASLEVIASNTPLIDVRAPVEFAQGSLPGAVNLPLMVDEERQILVETRTVYEPPFTVGLSQQTLRTFVFTRPRFAPQVLFDASS